MSIKITVEKHGVAFPTDVLAGNGGEHIYSLLMDKDRSNGEVVAVDAWQGMQYFSVKAPTGFAAEVLEQAANGNWYVRVTTAGDAVIIRSVPMIEEEYTKDIQAEANFYNAKDEIARGYRAHEGDIWELSEDLFVGTPEAGKTLSIKDSKWLVA